VASRFRSALHVLLRALSSFHREWKEDLQLRTKLLLSFVFLIAGLTSVTLLVVRHNARALAQQRIEQDVKNAILTFQVVERQQQRALSHKADLLAWVAFLRNGDVTAINDASEDPWQSDDCNLFVLTDRNGKILALHSRTWQTFPPAIAQQMAARSVRRGETSSWWFGGGNLYQVVLQPFYEDASTKKNLLGFVVVGRSIDQRAVTDLSRSASTDIVFQYGDEVAVGTLDPLKQADLPHQLHQHLASPQLNLRGEQFYTASFNLTPDASSGASLVVLKSYNELEGYLQRLNHLLFGLGLAAILAGGALIFVISDTVTRPLGLLVQGVRALERGDFSYPLELGGHNELATLTKAFNNMRSTLQRNDTQREQLQAQLRQAQKMEALGRLAGGVAHDFNNLLTVIRGHSELLLDRVRPDDPLHTHAQQIRKTSDRAASLTRQLLAFSRMQVLEPKVLDVNELIADMGKLLRRLIRENIEFSLRLGDSLGRVKGDPGQLEQVFLNLTVNASDAMSSGGRLTIETKNVLVDAEYCRIRPSVEPGNYVMVSVTDTGHGMDAAIKAQIFEPFFTTKERGKGTGLGLATVYGIVKQTGGFIWVDSEPDLGTRFEIYLPSTAEPVGKHLGSDRLETLTAPARRSKTVLIVEDEREVRELACEFLSVAGYSVLTAQDGWEALDTAKRLGRSIHVVLTDLVMPNMGGIELGDRLKSLLPQVAIIYMTGYLEQGEANAAFLKDAFFLQKPFSRDTLVEKISLAVNRSHAERAQANTFVV
jgi:signal transduction histidine kinase/ActR/RegA family two-component response regulator